MWVFARAAIALAATTLGCRARFDPAIGTPDGPLGDAAGDAAGDAPSSYITGRRIFGGWGLNVNLTTEGVVDWRHWAPGIKDRKMTVAPRISDYAIVGNGALLGGNNADPIAWDDGTPTAVATDIRSYVFLDTGGPQGDGLAFTISGDSEPHTLSVYVGNWCLGIRFEAAFSDGSAPAYVDTAWEVVSPRTEYSTYVVDFQSLTGADLEVRYTIEFNYCTTGDVGETKLAAATLR